MSGGSLDYLFGRVHDAASTIRGRCKEPEMRAFAHHLDMVAKALHDVEWYLNGDIGHESALASVATIVTPQDVLVMAVADARFALAGLENALAKAEAVR